MDLFKLTSDEVGIYARVPQHIVDLVSHYRARASAKGQLTDTRLSKWVSKVPTLEDVVKVNKGGILYHVGMVCLATDEDKGKDLFSEKMQVTEDFEVAVSPEAVLYFAQQRAELPSLKRGDLYKFHVDNPIFGELYFIPEDIMNAIVAYDLTPHLEAAIKFRDRIETVKAGHPRLA